MSAQIHFNSGREPSQVEALPVPHEERRLRKVILRRYGLHRLIRKPLVKRAYSSRIAGKNPAGKRVDLINRNLHIP